MRIIWSPRAKRKVYEYGEYITQDNPDAASEWIMGILDEVERLKVFPEQGRKVPEAKRADVREIFFQNHRIVYRIESKRIVILTVRHTRQLLDQKEL
jgi:addiction module RelE/StbE family toxin